MTSLSKSLKKKEKGQSMVEFALVIPVLLLIVIGIIEFGFMFSNYLTLTNASREATRYISLGGDDVGAILRANNVAVNTDPNRMIINISPTSSNRSRGDSVTVEINYAHDFLTPFMDALLGSNFNLKVKATMRVE